MAPVEVMCVIVVYNADWDDEGAVIAEFNWVVDSGERQLNKAGGS